MTTLTDSHIFVGNSSNIATDVPMSGDATIDDMGAVTVSIGLNNLTDVIVNGSDNMFLGTLSGASLTTGNGNTALGSNSLYSVSSNTGCTALGYNAGNALTAGADYTVAIGYRSLDDCTTSAANNAIGAFSLHGLVTGESNCAFGNQAGQDVNGGSHNVLIGAEVAQTLGSGSNNIIIGYNADVPTASTSNYLNIGDAITGDMTTGPALMDGFTATTQSPGDNSTQVATTAYVDAAVGSAGTVTSVAASGSQGVTISGSPITTTGTIAIGLGAITPTSVAASGTVTGSNLSGTNTGDQTITLTGDVTGSGTGSFATTIKSSVALAGSPTTTTQSAGDNSTKIATTAYVDAAVSVAAVVLTGYMSGCLVTNDATTPNTKVDIAAGIAANSTGAAYIKSAGYTVDFSSSGAVNKLDTGTIAASTWYHVFVIARADGTTGGLASLSATAPTLPSGYTVFKRVGSVLTDSSSHILGFKASYTGGGTTTQYWNASVLDISTTTLGASSTTFTLTVPTGVICEAIMQTYLTTASIINIRCLDQPDEATSATAAPLFTHGSAGGGANQGGDHIRLQTNTSAQIAMRGNAAGTGIKGATLGWVDYRGT